MSFRLRLASRDRCRLLNYGDGERGAPGLLDSVVMTRWEHLAGASPTCQWCRLCAGRTRVVEGDDLFVGLCVSLVDSGVEGLVVVLALIRVRMVGWTVPR